MTRYEEMTERVRKAYEMNNIPSDTPELNFYLKQMSTCQLESLAEHWEGAYRAASGVGVTIRESQEWIRKLSGFHPHLPAPPDVITAVSRRYDG